MTATADWSLPMASVFNPPQRLRRLKAAEAAFAKAGWKVTTKAGFTIDFEVAADRLFFALKYVDETRKLYASPGDIMQALEGHAHKMRNLRNQQFIVIFDREFLSVPLESLIERGIFAITPEDLHLVVELAIWRDGIPKGLEPRQQYLLEHCIDYAMAVSGRCLDKGDVEAAVVWARHAVRHSVGFTQAYYKLFNLLKDIGEFDAAAELGKQIGQYRNDDPRFLRGMVDLERRRGDKAAASRWMARLTEQPTTPRSIEAVIAKQREENGLPAKGPALKPAESRTAETIAPKFGLAGLLTRFGRGRRQ